MFKIMLCIIIVASSSAAGFYYSHKLYDRKRILQNFVLELKKCSTLINYTSDALYKIFDGNFMNYEFSENVSFEAQWIEMLSVYKDKLKAEDIDCLGAFGRSLGTSDVNSEQKNIMMYIEMLNKCISDAENDILVKSKLYRIYGFSIGVTVSILLI